MVNFEDICECVWHWWSDTDNIKPLRKISLIAHIPSLWCLADHRSHVDWPSNPGLRGDGPQLTAWGTLKRVRLHDFKNFSSYLTQHCISLWKADWLMFLRETIADYSHNSINSNGIRYSGKIAFFLNISKFNPVITTSVYATPRLHRQVFLGTNWFLSVNHNITLG